MKLNKKTIGEVIILLSILSVGFALSNNMFQSATYNGTYSERNTSPQQVSLTDNSYITDSITNYQIIHPYHSSIYGNLVYDSPTYEDPQAFSSDNLDMIGDLSSIGKDVSGGISIDTNLVYEETDDYHISQGTKTGGTLISLQTEGDFDKLSFLPAETYVNGLENPISMSSTHVDWVEGGTMWSDYHYTSEIPLQLIKAGQTESVMYRIKELWDAPISPVKEIGGFDTIYLGNEVNTGFNYDDCNIFETLNGEIETYPLSNIAGIMSLAYDRGVPIQAGISPHKEIEIAFELPTYDQEVFETEVVYRQSDTMKNPNVPTKLKVIYRTSQDGLPLTIAGETFTSSSTLDELDIDSPSTTQIIMNEGDGWSSGDWIEIYLFTEFIYGHQTDYMRFEGGFEYMVDGVWYHSSSFYGNKIYTNPSYDVYTSTNVDYSGGEWTWQLNLDALDYYDPTKDILLDFSSLATEGFRLHRVGDGSWIEEPCYFTQYRTEVSSPTYYQRYRASPKFIDVNNHYLLNYDIELNCETKHIWGADISLTLPSYISSANLIAYLTDGTTRIKTITNGFNEVSFDDCWVDHFVLHASKSNMKILSSEFEEIEIDYFRFKYYEVEQKQATFTFDESPYKLTNDIEIVIEYQADHDLVLDYYGYLYTLPAHATMQEERITEEYQANLDMKLKYYDSSTGFYGDQVHINSFYVRTIYNIFDYAEFSGFQYETNGIAYSEDLLPALNFISHTDFSTHVQFEISSNQFTYYSDDDLYIPDQELFLELDLLSGMTLNADYWTTTMPSVVVTPEQDLYEVVYGYNEIINFEITDAEGLYYTMFWDGDYVSGHILQTIDSHPFSVQISLEDIGLPIDEGTHQIQVAVSDGVEEYYRGSADVDIQAYVPSQPEIITLSQQVFDLEKQITWSEATHADWYIVYKDGVEQGTTENTYYDLTLTDENRQVEVVVAGANYYTETASDSIILTQVREIPEQNVLVSESQTISDSESFALEWTFDPYAEGYRIYSNGSVVKEIHDYSLDSSDNVIPYENGWHEITLSAYNRYGEGVQSESIWVKLEEIPKSPCWITSEQIIENQITFQLQWLADTNVELYHLYNSTDRITTTEDTTYMFSTESVNRTYSFSLKGENEFGVSELSTEISLEFKIYYPSKPVIITQNQTNNGSFSLMFEESEWEVGYRIYLNDSLYTSLTNTEYQFNLPYTNRTYLIKTEAYNEYGSTFSDPIEVKVCTYLPHTPVFHNETGWRTDRHVFLGWGNSTNATGYYLFHNEGLLLNTTRLNTSILINETNSVNEFYLLGYNEYGNSSKSEVLTLNIFNGTLAKPVLDYEIHPNHSVSVSWDAEAWATGYRLYNTNLNTTNRYWDTRQTRATYNLPYENATYEFYVEAYNPVAVSLQSDTIEVSIVVYNASSPSWQTPSQTIPQGEFEVQWTEGNHAEGYILLINEQEVLRTNTTSARLDLPLGEYRIEVLAYNDLGNSTLSEPLWITIAEPTDTEPEGFWKPTYTYIIVGVGGAGVVGGGIYYFVKRKK